MKYEINIKSILVGAAIGAVSLGSLIGCGGEIREPGTTTHYYGTPTPTPTPIEQCVNDAIGEAQDYVASIDFWGPDEQIKTWGYSIQQEKCYPRTPVRECRIEWFQTLIDRENDYRGKEVDDMYLAIDTEFNAMMNEGGCEAAQ